MKFIKVATDENFNVLKFKSEEGKWEVGLSTVLFGVRIVLAPAGECYRTLNYCAGSNRVLQAEILWAVIVILLPISEDTPSPVIEKAFPTYRTKPIDLDPCLGNLRAMRDKVISELSELQPEN